MKSSIPFFFSLVFVFGSGLKAQEALLDGQRNLAVETYEWLLTEKPGKNFIFSPTSIQAVLAMIAEGAVGETKTEMLPFLDPTGTGEAVGADFGILAGQLTSERVQVALSTAFYSDPSLGVLPSYAEALENAFGTHLQRMDFSPPDAVIEDANGWVIEQTNGKIEELVTEDLFTELTVMLWLSTQYLKGEWQHAFAEEFTTERPFFHDDGRESAVAFMSHRFGGVVREDTERGIVSAELALEDTDFAAVFLVPQPVTGTARPLLAELEEKLSPEVLQSHLTLNPAGDHQILLPKFSFESEFPLHTAFKALGITRAFSMFDAEFWGISEQYSALQKGRHQAVIEVNESGLEAVGASAMTGGITSVPTPLHFDRPFLVLVYHKPTGALLFLGRVVDPSGTEEASVSAEVAAQTQLLGEPPVGDWPFSWLGYANLAAWPWVHSIPYGWMCVTEGATSETAWFYHQKGGWLWSNAALSPFAWSLEYGWIFQAGEILESNPPQTDYLWWYLFDEDRWIER